MFAIIFVFFRPKQGTNQHLLNSESTIQEVDKRLRRPAKCYVKHLKFDGRPCVCIHDDFLRYTRHSVYGRYATALNYYTDS